MLECSQPGRPKASTAFETEPPEGGEQVSPPPGRGMGGGGVTAAGSVLAFDFGVKRIGVAIGTLLGAGQPGPARALTTIDTEANDARFAAIAVLIAEWQPVRLLVGRPLNDDGTPHEMTVRCERFANQLRGRYRLPVDEVDERFTSLEADASLRERGLSWQARKAQVDAEAALIILQSWFENHVHTPA
jgi:putative Holliday junction resolvase